ncbi:MAG: methyltransferase [Bradymonadaceae bacterium]|nr:methyltransferase [Lujinxingiaceae bacterium]
MPGEQTTHDAIFGGEALIVQHRHGYRFGMDALLLATDLPPFAHDATIVDLGSGHGPAAIAIAIRYPQARIVAVDRQSALLALLEQSIALNALTNIDVLQADIRDFRTGLAPHSASLVVCNPPYFRPGNQRTSESLERAEARHELHGGLADFIAAARYVLEPGGHLKMITPPTRLGEVYAAIDATDLRLKSLRFFHATAQREAYLVEYVLRRGAVADFVVLPPLVISDSEGVYTAEVAARLVKRVAP